MIKKITRKPFIRFIIDTKNNNKIKAMQKITKIYEDDKFVEIKQPFIYASQSREEIEIDIEGHDDNKYLPLRYLKYENGKVIQKTQAEKDETDSIYEQRKAERLIEIQEKENEVQENKNIVIDKNKSLQDRVNAMAKLLELKENF